MKTIKIVTCCMLLASAVLPAYVVSAAEEATPEVSIRIEGCTETLYDDTLALSGTDVTLQQALLQLDEAEDTLTITGLDSAYITDINGEAAGSFGGWDGWLYQYNGADTGVGIDACVLADGDSVVLYYGDPFGAGMQYPVLDDTQLADGILTFTSKDTTYNADGTVTVTENPVVGATISWDFGTETATYLTDASGAIEIAAAQLTAGAHTVQISKQSDTGLPLVLRFAADMTVTVPAQLDVTTTSTTVTAAVSATTTVTTTIAATTGTITATVTVPATGDTAVPALLLTGGMLLLCCAGRKRD